MNMENKDVTNSCLMWAVNLDTPVDLGAVFDSDDLKDTGIELDSHITLLYAREKYIQRENLLNDIKTILGESDFEDFLELCKSGHDGNVLNLFDLGSFENDSDYVVLKMKRDNEIFDMLSLINKGLKSKYDVDSDFDSYTPHITLAELNPGTANKYMTSDTLHLVLDDSYIDFEDLFISYGSANDTESRKQYFLTQYCCIDRYFRIQHLKKLNSEID